MDNLDFGNIAIATVIVGFLNLIIVVLTKTETILTIVERIKGVVRLDYKGRAKRNDDEVRILKKHSLVASTRVRHSFVTMEKWDCKWTWNWSENLEPINIKSYCTGSKYEKCNQPVYGYYHFPDESENSPYVTVGITCTNTRPLYHSFGNDVRAKFKVFQEETEERTAEEALNAIISKAILAERDLRIAEEIKQLRRQFWR